MRLLLSLPIASAVLLTASCGPSSPAPSGTAPAVRDALLTEGVAFLSARVDSVWPTQPRGHTFLAAARLESTNQLHTQDWLNEAGRSTDGLCHPPEAQCFGRQSGTLLALGLPRVDRADTLALAVEIRVFERYPIDPKARIPPTLRPSEPLSRWTTTFSWTLRAVADSGGSVRIVRTTKPVRSAVRP